jgi:hypothetical protein
LRVTHKSVASPYRRSAAWKAATSSNEAAADLRTNTWDVDDKLVIAGDFDFEIVCIGEIGEIGEIAFDRT